VNPPYTPKLGGNPMKLSTEQQWRAWLIQQARRIVHCQDDAEDVVQDTLLAYWKRFGSLPWDECADDTQLQRKCAWCCQKLRALALDSCRRAHRRYEMLMLCCNDTQSDYRRSPLKARHTHNHKKTAVQVIHHTLRQHLTTRQLQLPTTNPIPKLALDYRNHRLHLPTLTIQPARFDTRHNLCPQHTRPRPQPPSTTNRRHHIRPRHIPPINPCIR
jgi:DNA-directed RNA polymerase specialized sigma24 family protein